LSASEFAILLPFDKMIYSSGKIIPRRRATMIPPDKKVFVAVPKDEFK